MRVKNIQTMRVLVLCLCFFFCFRHTNCNGTLVDPIVIAKNIVHLQEQLQSRVEAESLRVQEQQQQQKSRKEIDRESIEAIDNDLRFMDGELGEARKKMRQLVEAVNRTVYKISDDKLAPSDQDQTYVAAFICLAILLEMANMITSIICMCLNFRERSSNNKSTL